MPTGLAQLTPFYEQTTMANVVIETPRGMPVKLKYDEKNDVFRVHKGMPVGFEFPFNFGFVPRTVGGDGDPLDVLVLSAHVMPAGTVVVGRIVSVLEAEQFEGKKKERNDRLIVTPWDLVSQSPMLPQLSFDETLKHAIIEFFTKNNEAQRQTIPPSAVRARTARHPAHPRGCRSSFRPRIEGQRDGQFQRCKRSTGSQRAVRRIIHLGQLGSCPRYENGVDPGQNLNISAPASGKDYSWPSILPDSKNLSGGSINS